MPQLRVKGIAVDAVCAISGKLLEELAEICECGTDNFTIDCLTVVSVFGGRVAETYPFVEVAWFERGQEIRDRVARSITAHVRSQGIHEVEVAFVTYREDSYYTNGEHYG